MATALFGTLQEFQPENDSITAYLERAELFCKTNDIADGKKVAVLLSVLGARLYVLLRSLVAPELPQDQIGRPSHWKTYRAFSSDISSPSL